MSRAPYGSVLAGARQALAERGVVATWELVALGHSAGHYPLRKLVATGEAVQVRGSTLYARPDVANAIEAAIASVVEPAVLRDEEARAAE